MLFDRKEIFEGRVIKVSVDTVDLPNGVRLPLEIVRHPGGAAAVAIDADNRVCLLRQYRHAAGGYIYELPAGKLEPDEPPEVTVQRELAEEAAVSAAHWESLGAYFSSPGVFTEVIHLYLATELSPAAAAPEAGEVFQVEWWPLEVAVEKARSGELTDAQNHHRNSASRVTPKNCVKRFTARDSRVPEMVAMSNNEIGASVILGPCQITIQTANPRRPPTGAVRRRSCTTNVVTRVSNGSTRVTPACRSSARRCPSSRLRHAVTAPSSPSSATAPVVSIRTPASAQRTFPKPRSRRCKRDLRKLGEWIKLKRELDERKAQDDHDVE